MPYLRVTCPALEADFRARVAGQIKELLAQAAAGHGPSAAVAVRLAEARALLWGARVLADQGR